MRISFNKQGVKEYFKGFVDKEMWYWVIEEVVDETDLLEIVFIPFKFVFLLLLNVVAVVLMPFALMRYIEIFFKD